MPSVLTKDGWLLFNTQREADEFRAKMEAKEKIINAGMQGSTVPESEQALLMGENDSTFKTQDSKAEDESPLEFIKNLKRKIGRRN